MTTSGEIKTALLCYFRFKRHELVATEVGGVDGIADILSCTKDLKKTTEVEVKISLSDLRADFVNKLRKHSFIDSRYRPNLMYFCLPEELVPRARKIIEKQGNIYGVMSYKRHFNPKYPEESITVIKRAISHKVISNKRLFNFIAMRASSELSGKYIKEYFPEEKRIKDFDEYAKQILQ